MRIPFKLSILATAVILAGCGGGGGGNNTNTNPTNPPEQVNPNPPDNGNDYERDSVEFHTPESVDVYVPMTGTGINAPVADVFAEDLNGDTVDEVVIGGRLTQPATAATWRNTNLQLYGWNTGSFSNETSSWFSGTDNEIIGTEPSVKFGDFDGDGNLDMFTAPSTDMNSLYGKAVVFSNTGASSFTRTEISVGNTWAHDSWVGDLNGDGRDDIVMLDYGSNMSVNYGNADGTFDTYIGGYGGSGISIADYLGNGTMTMIMSDDPSGGDGNDDTALYNIDTSSGTVILTKIADLPESRFLLPKWSEELDDASDNTSALTEAHAIRNFSFDFNNDGLLDVVVMDVLFPNAGWDDSVSELQFLRNDGGGAFTDVTDSVLVNYDTSVQGSYNPTLMDLNNDGLLDIFMTSSDYGSNGIHDGTRVLIQTSDGQFVEKYSEVFTDFYTQITNSTTDGYVLNWRQPIQIITGPGGEKYLFSTVIFTKDDNVKGKTYLAKIDTDGVSTVPQTAADIIRAEWPYLSNAEVNTILANTTELSINGIEYDDVMSSLNPIGGLGVAIDGNSSRVKIAGNISIPGFNLNSLSNIQALDFYGRNYSVDMSSMGFSGLPQLNIQPINTQTQSWMTNYVANGYQSQGIWAFGDSNQYSISANNTILNTDWQYGISHTLMNTSPWMAFDGVFGEINNSNTLEVNLGKGYKNGMWSQVGIMHTKTDFTPGLVTQVSDIQSVYGVIGYQDNEWDLQTGFQPLIVNGTVNMKLPTSIDSLGNLQYTDYDVDVKNNLDIFVNFTRTFNVNYFNIKLNGQTSTEGNNSASVTLEAEL